MGQYAVKYVRTKRGVVQHYSCRNIVLLFSFSTDIKSWLHAIQHNYFPSRYLNEETTNSPKKELRESFFGDQTFASHCTSSTITAGAVILITVSHMFFLSFIWFALKMYIFCTSNGCFSTATLAVKQDRTSTNHPLSNTGLFLKLIFFL